MKKLKHLPWIDNYVIPHNEQRYNTAGDYDEDKHGWWITISKMERWEYEALCYVHEIIEMILTKQRNISWNKITQFDKLNLNHPDPGSLKSAPYHKEHMFALKIEKMLCKELGISWKKYDNSFNKLKWGEQLKNRKST